ncbi:MAG: hypothetical protein JWO13_813 [Acidobacteriales bacterium]|nr:hypothetical protein [Terriglobales bacterium]
MNNWQIYRYNKTSGKTRQHRIMATNLTESDARRFAEDASKGSNQWAYRIEPMSQLERYYDTYKDGTQSLKWGSPLDVGHLIVQLQTLDPKMKVSSVTFIELEGKTRARAYGLSMSRERWNQAGWLDYKLDVPESLAIWASEPREELERALTVQQTPSPQSGATDK